MDKFTICIGRQLGSGGKEIAEKLANKLNITAYDKKLLKIAANASGLETTIFEKADECESSSFIGSLLNLRETVSEYFTGNNIIGNDQLFAIQSEVMRQISQKESSIFIGRCAEYVLREQKRMISIFITADIEDRIGRVMKNSDINREKSIEEIEKTDKKRASYHDYYCSSEWGKAATYDLCINSSRLGIQATTNLIYEFAIHVLNINK